MEKKDLWSPFQLYCDCAEKIENVGKCKVCGIEWELYEDDFGFKHYLKTQTNKSLQQTNKAG